MVKKVLIVFVVVFALFMVWTQPAAAADMVQAGLSFVGDLFERVIVFFTELAE